jgi:spore maturation protein CgeB
MAISKVILVGSFSSFPGCLEESYSRGFESLGWNVVRFDFIRSLESFIKMGVIGRKLNNFFPVEIWTRKANRELVITVRKEMPDILIVCGQVSVQVGSLAQIKAACNTVKIVLLWPDTFVNMSDAVVSSLPLYDLIACYSRMSCNIFEKLGARRAEWVPLGADPSLHAMKNDQNGNLNQKYLYDVSFVGNWRPEREAVMARICEIPGLSVKIWGGGDWRIPSKKRTPVYKAFQGPPLFGEKFSEVVMKSKISMNIIDNTNYPAANMRFFEIPCAGGLQVCSFCPEMESMFKHGESIFYYQSINDVADIIRYLLGNEFLRNQVAKQANSMVLSEHTYEHRIRQIIGLLN